MKATLIYSILFVIVTISVISYWFSSSDSTGFKTGFTAEIYKVGKFELTDIPPESYESSLDKILYIIRFIVISYFVFKLLCLIIKDKKLT